MPKPLTYRRPGLPVDPATGRGKAEWKVTERSKEMVRVPIARATMSRPDACQVGAKCIRREGHDGECYPK